MSVKAQSGFIDTISRHSAFCAWQQKDAFKSKHEWDLLRGYDSVVK